MGLSIFFWSFDVLCNNNLKNIEAIHGHSFTKMMPGEHSAYQYGDWDKLDRYGWENGGIPIEYRGRPDDEIWWPRNNSAQMKEIVEKAGW